MDPVSIIGLVNASIGLAIKIGQTVKDVQTISSQYKYAEVSIAALSNECRTFATVLKKIEVWLRIVDSDVTHDELILEQLSSSLECGNIVLEAINDDLLDFTKTGRKKSSRSKTKFLFNEGVFDAHQKRIGGQLQALSCLLQSMNLPTPAVQRKHIDDNETIFRAAESSAWTILDSGGSIRTWQTDRAMPDDGVDLIYRPLSFENALFTSRVYKRNFRPKNKELVPRAERETGLKDQTPLVWVTSPPSRWTSNERHNFLAVPMARPKPGGGVVNDVVNELERYLEELTNDLWYPSPNTIMSDKQRGHVHEHVLYLMHRGIRPRDKFFQSLCNQSDSRILGVLESIRERDDLELHDWQNLIEPEGYRTIVEESEKGKNELLRWLAAWGRRTSVITSSYPCSPPEGPTTGEDEFQPDDHYDASKLGGDTYTEGPVSHRALVDRGYTGLNHVCG